MLKAFKYRLYPTEEQSVLINKHIGAARFVYNLALEVKQSAYSSSRKVISCFDLIKQLPDLKKECTWLSEINSQSLQQSIRNLDNAFIKFFKKQADFPKFKKKSDKGSFNIPQSVGLKDELLIIPKFKKGIEMVLHRPIMGIIRQATISRTPTGKYFVSLLCETGEDISEKKVISPQTTIGVDLGIKSFLVTSEKQVVDNPKFLRKSIPRLKYLQRKHSKYNGKRTKQKLCKLHEKIANQRKDFLHKVSTQLIKNHDNIAIEVLRVSNMLKSHNLAQSIHDCSWAAFIDMLEYKGLWFGNNILRIGMFEPSSKTCSCCGSAKKELSLKEREWYCDVCSLVLDRDINAAINIKNFALRNYLSGTDRKNRNELPTLVGVMTSEA